MDVLKQTYERLNKLFPITSIYTTTVPTYPGGLWSFTLASKKFEPNRLKEKWEVKKTNYVNQDIMERSFSLPAFMKKIFHQKNNKETTL